MVMHLVKSLYLPKDALQGSEFPAHIIWDSSVNMKEIIILLPPKVTLKEMYNVEEGGFELNRDILKIFRLEENGYVGLVFKSEKLNSPDVERTITFKLKTQDGSTIQATKHIYLFRPEISVQVPLEINIEKIKRKDELKLNPKVQLKNIGRGTALVFVDAQEDNEIAIKNPEDSQEFFLRFMDDLKKNFDKLKKEYPEYKDVLDNILLFIRLSRESITGETIKMGKQLGETLDTIAEENEEFLEHFINAIGEAYFINLNIFTQLDSLLEFLRSSVEHNVLLLNAMALLEVPQTEAKLRLKLQVTDLAGNTYPIIPISCNVHISSASSKDVLRIPIYKIIDMGDMK